MFIRCGRRIAINPMNVAYIEESNLADTGPHPLRVGLSVGVVLDLSHDEAVPLRDFLNRTAPLPAERVATPAESAPVKPVGD